MITQVFDNVEIVVEVLTLPKADGSGLAKMRCLTITDPASRQQFRLPMSEETSRKIGSKLMGLGELEVVNGTTPPAGGQGR